MLADYANVVVRLSEFLEEPDARPRTFETGGRQMIEITKPRRLDSNT